MQTVVVEVTNLLGLHARPAKTFVRAAKQFSSEITLRKEEGGQTANAKSILAVMGLGAGQGTRIVLGAEGSDEMEAVRALKELFDRNLMEADSIPV